MDENLKKLIEITSQLRKKIHILVVEDNREFSGVLSRIMQYISDVEVYNAFDGKTAFSLINEHITKETPFFDLIWVDLILPDINGLEIVKYITNISPIIPVIICSGKDIPKEYEQCLQNNKLVIFIKKPVSIDEIRLILRLANTSFFYCKDCPLIKASTPLLKDI